MLGFHCAYLSLIWLNLRLSKVIRLSFYPFTKGALSDLVTTLFTHYILLAVARHDCVLKESCVTDVQCRGGKRGGTPRDFFNKI